MATVYQIEPLFSPQLPEDKRPYDLNFQTAVKTSSKKQIDAVNSLALTVNVVAFRQSPYSIKVVRNQFISASAGAGADTVLVLPKATGSTNVVEVQKADANVHNIVVNPTGLDKIGTANAADTITTQGAHVRYLDYVAGNWAKLG